MKTVDKLKQLIPGMPVDFLDQLRTFPSTEQANEAIMFEIINIAVEDDDGVFLLCDHMETLIDGVDSRRIIDLFKNGQW